MSITTEAPARATLALLVAGLGIFMVFLDTQILFVAFGDIEGSGDRAVLVVAAGHVTEFTSFGSCPQLSS